MTEIELPSGKMFLLAPMPPRSAGRRRRARERASGPGWTKQEFRDLCEKYGNKCLCCGEAKSLVADHVVPMVSGGAHALSNVQPLCHQCNFRKGLRVIDYR